MNIKLIILAIMYIISKLLATGKHQQEVNTTLIHQKN